jgi:hypothetical protein
MDRDAPFARSDDRAQGVTRPIHANSTRGQIRRFLLLAIWQGLNIMQALTLTKHPLWKNQTPKRRKTRTLKKRKSQTLKRRKGQPSLRHHLQKKLLLRRHRRSSDLRKAEVGSQEPSFAGTAARSRAANLSVPGRQPGRLFLSAAVLAVEFDRDGTRDWMSQMGRSWLRSGVYLDEALRSQSYS